jgi:hypothetical protein
MPLIKCTFTSIWDDDSIVTTPCTLIPETGEVNPEVSTGPIPSGCLKREFISFINGDEHEVCPTCHSYILKTVVGDRADLSFGESQECSDPNCSDEE